jgi:hypothetical protein
LPLLPVITQPFLPIPFLPLPFHPFPFLPLSFLALHSKRRRLILGIIIVLTQRLLFILQVFDSLYLQLCRVGFRV